METVEAKIRNQLSPFWNLVAMMQDPELEAEEELLQHELKQCVKSQEKIIELLKESEGSRPDKKSIIYDVCSWCDDDADGMFEAYMKDKEDDKEDE